MPDVSIHAFKKRITPILKHFFVGSAAIDAVCEAYAEEWRDYHSSRHIMGMLHTAARLPISLEDRWLLSLLIIYHDVWYKIGRESGENERRSADWAIRDLAFYPGDTERLFLLVRQGIEATINHTLDGVDRRFVSVVSYLLDLDLWGLGQPPVRFQQDTEAVWHEFQPRYTREEFDRGRSAWAAKFLERPRIYHTMHFSCYEGDARENLRRLARQ